MMQSVLVIGSNSFSGASFIAYLLKMGITVIGVSRSKEKNGVFLPYQWEDCSRFEFHQVDLNHQLDELMTLIHRHKPKYIVNFSAQSMVAQSWEHPEHWMQTNVVAMVKLHQRLKDLDFLDKYVHISTPEVYGSCSGYIKENNYYNPSTPYAVSRAAADMSLKTFFEAYQFPVVTTRAANVYGPGQQLYRIIPRTIFFIKMGKKLELHGGGISERSFIHMSDVSNATWKIALQGKVGETYHIATKECITVKALVQKICDMMAVNFDEVVEIADERLGKDTAYLLDSHKLRDELEWSDSISLESGVSDTIGWVTSYFDTLKDQPALYIHTA